MNPLLIVGILAVVLVGSKAASTSDDSFNRWDGLFKKYGARYNVPWEWLKAIAMNESSLGDNSRVKRGLEAPWDIEGSKSYDGLSWGLMQMTLGTARMFNSVITAQGLNDPEISVSLAAQYVAYLIKLKGISNVESVIRSYNGGPGWRQSSASSLANTQTYYDRFLRNLARVQAA